MLEREEKGKESESDEMSFQLEKEIEGEEGRCASDFCEKRETLALNERANAEDIPVSQRRVSSPSFNR